MSTGISNVEVSRELCKAVLGPGEGESLIKLVLRENGGETWEKEKTFSQNFSVKMNKEMRQFLEWEVWSSRDDENKQRGTL